ncbi:MAG: hypothetical protein LC659_02615 [Myxococcales bacterium]|nr:hypothetical protein [Myxococcales bacterium]
MRNTAIAMLVAGTMAMGCASAPKHEARGPMPSEKNDSAVATAKESPKAKEQLGGAGLKIVAHKPSAQKYHFVGRVEARATTADIVDAAIAADADLRRQAKKLGADVVKIDVIAPPSERAGAHSRVILAGRAYKKSS